MSTDNDPSVTDSAPHVLAKWPFILGDLMLVSSALAVWATQSPLSAMEMMFCLGAVGGGAVLFALPYALEYHRQTRLSRADFAPSPGGGSPRLADFEGDLRRQLRAATEILEQATRANAAMEGTARRFEARLAALSEIQKNIETASSTLHETAFRPPGREPTPLPRELEKLRQDQAEKFKSTEEKLTVLAETLAALIAQAEKPARTMAVEEPPVARSETRVPPPAPAPEKKPEGLGSLMAKALATVQPTEESSAVAGIIQSRPRRPRKPKPEPMPAETMVPAEATAGVAQPAVAAVVMAVETAPEVKIAPAESENWEALAAGKFETVTRGADLSAETATAVAEPPPVVQAMEPLAAVAESIPVAVAVEAPAVVEPVFPKTEEPEEFATETKRSARAKAAALREADDEEAVAAVKVAAVKVDAVKVDAPAQTELLAGEAEPTRKRRPAKSAGEAASLVARVLIGIGNKPYVRGEGPGLSADKGVPMEFVEIGQWRWVAPESSKEAIILRIFKNDEIEAKGKPIVLKPGQSVEVSPEFAE